MNENNFLPKNEAARIAVEKARRIVRENNEMVNRLKLDSNIDQLDVDPFLDAEVFSHQDSHSFDLYKIRSKSGIGEFLKDMFGVS